MHAVGHAHVNHVDLFALDHLPVIRFPLRVHLGGHPARGFLHDIHHIRQLHVAHGRIDLRVHSAEKAASNDRNPNFFHDDLPFRTLT